MGLRSRLTAAIGASGLASAQLLYRQFRPSPWLMVVNYHRIGMPSATLDSDVFDATPEKFDAQMAFVRKHFSPVGIEQLFAYVRGEPLPPNPFLVTFDDGYRDNLTVAAPILAKHGIRATFFVATDFVTERRMFWWDVLAHLVMSSKRDFIDMLLPHPHRLQLGDLKTRHASLKVLLRTVKDTFGIDVPAFISYVARACGVEWTRDDDRELAEKNIMTWNEVRELAALGMDIGSHTRSHRILRTVPADQLASELSGSRQDLERELGHSVRSLAFPAGRAIANVAPIVAAIDAAGYEVAFSTEKGLNSLRNRRGRFDIRRRSVDASLSIDHFVGMMSIPEIA